jgi:hypothetical protein
MWCFCCHLAPSSGKIPWRCSYVMLPLAPCPIIWQNTVKMRLCDVSVAILPHHLAKWHEDAVMWCFCCHLTPSSGEMTWTDAVMWSFCWHLYHIWHNVMSRCCYMVLLLPSLAWSGKIPWAYAVMWCFCCHLSHNLAKCHEQMVFCDVSIAIFPIIWQNTMNGWCFVLFLSPSFP